MHRKIGITKGDINNTISQQERIEYINFKLATLNLATYQPANQTDTNAHYFIDLFDDIIKDYREKSRRIDSDKIGINDRINRFFSDYFGGLEHIPKVVSQTFSLDYYGLARELALPPNGDAFSNAYLKSYRITQGVLHNPKNDRRTTKGSFHIVEGPLAIPFDKRAVPAITFAKLYQQAVQPPKELMALPFTSQSEEAAMSFVSLLVKPIVAPEVPGISTQKNSEVLFVVPGSFVANLDFVESVFGNAGDHQLHVNDSGLDVEHWSGHTGYIILAPHLTKLKKIDLGLPHYNVATARQRRDGMCYRNEDELYNDGIPFKITCRDASGVAVTIIADNYFGYSKKEIKTQIGFAANLFGNVEEEHAGGTIAFTRVNLGENYYASRDSEMTGYTFEEVKRLYAYKMDIQPENYGIDKRHRNVIYLPENAVIDLHKTSITWQHLDEVQQLKLRPTYFYIMPNGTKIHMEKHPTAPAWKLVKTDAEGTFCHKPCTVSGGGKSEISKSLDNAIIYGAYYIQDFQHDFDQVEDVLSYDYSNRWIVNPRPELPSRPILSVERTLGSVIKLLTPSKDYTTDYNAYLASIPSHIKALVFLVKRFYQPHWGDDWRSHFNVDEINGRPGHELNVDTRMIRPSYLRVGFNNDMSWRIFKLRMDFMPTEKLQIEDDISASIVIPAQRLTGLNQQYANPSVKLVSNCEYRFFQRPDDAIYKGYDKDAERDLTAKNLFVTNYQPLTKRDVQALKDDVMGYITYTQPVVDHIDQFLKGDDQYCIVSSEPRLVDGKPSKNPRYLENRRDFTDPIKFYIAETGTRLARKVPLNKTVINPVNAILPGRRNNPASGEGDTRIRPLSVYNPIHYQPLPELFMDYISSLSGKSPSTTGAGSEGALTKSPFNMLLPIYDLNSALLSYILCDYQAFTTPAGFIGSRTRVDHDISMLIPELWARLKVSERNPAKLIAEGSLEKIDDFEHNGQKIPASILGYRISDTFLSKYMGKIFDEPHVLFSPDILKPELQNLNDFADGVLHIAENHQRIAKMYFEDGSVDDAIEPLKALLHIMAHDHYNNKTLANKEIRQLFSREYVMSSPWYQERLERKRLIDLALINKKVNNLERFIADPINASIIDQHQYRERLDKAHSLQAIIADTTYTQHLVGTLGADILSEI